MLVIYWRRHEWESISDKRYWRWDDRPLGNIAVLKTIARTTPRMRRCMFAILAKPRVRVSAGRRKGHRVLVDV